MRARLVLLFALSAICFPATAQSAPPKTKTEVFRTFVDSLDTSSGEAAVRGFVEAYAARDFFKAYFLLSPEAKSAFSTKVFEFNEGQFFPALANAQRLTRPANGGDDMIKDVFLDGALMFDTVMVNVTNQGALPFDLEAGTMVSATFEHEDQARYMVAAKGDPSVVLISAIRLSSGDWRVERIVWAASDPQARPWGFN